MIELNWLVILSTALVPLAVGALWYGPLFGKAWMVEAEMSEDKIMGANMMKIYGLALVFGLMLSVGLTPVVIHQMGVFSTLQNLGVETPGSEANLYLQDFISKYGTQFRTFKHGALHGFITGLFIFLPVMGTNALFERRSWKYIFMNVGYWALSAAIMGGIISAFA
jgi:Protein of unknown function (DUF1761)